MRKLAEKVAIVTGAGQGIGRGIALAFAKEGAKVVIAEINPQTGRGVADEVRNLGEAVLAIACDVGNESEVKRMVADAVKAFGPIDILVNNAHKLPPKPSPLEQVDEEEWDKNFQTGPKAVLYCCKAVFPYMKNRGGKIINICSRAGIDGQPMLAAYSASKEAIRTLSKSAAREWGKYNINVNVICPVVQSAARAAWAKQFPELERNMLAARPIQRLGDPESDVGRTAVFFASKDADFITGQTIMVDGGDRMF